MQDFVTRSRINDSFGNSLAKNECPILLFKDDIFYLKYHYHHMLIMTLLKAECKNLVPYFLHFELRNTNILKILPHNIKGTVVSEITTIPFSLHHYTNCFVNDSNCAALNFKSWCTNGFSAKPSI